MRKLNTLFNEFINAPIQLYSGATFKKGLNSLLDVYDNTVAGDLVIVKGNHDIGNNSIQLKDGVNWEFKGNPIITSSSSNGTIIGSDAPLEISTSWSGTPLIRNTSDSDKIFQKNMSIDGFKMAVNFYFRIDYMGYYLTKKTRVFSDYFNNEKIELVLGDGVMSDPSQLYLAFKGANKLPYFLLGDYQDNSIYPIIWNMTLFKRSGNPSLAFSVALEDWSPFIADSMVGYHTILPVHNSSGGLDNMGGYMVEIVGVVSDKINP